MPILGVIASAIVRTISDLFNRTTSGSLGTANSGQTWNATRGVWFANGSQAQSDTAASSYPIASIPFSANTIVSADINDGGPGLAFWVTDANSWWGSSVNYRTTTSSYTCCGGGTGGTNVGCGETTVTQYYQRSGCGCYSNAVSCGSGCCDSDSLQPLGPECCGSSLGGSNTGCGSTPVPVYYQYTTCTDTNYITELKIYSSVSSVVSAVATQQLASNTTAYSKARSLEVSTSSNTITVKAYSNAGLSTQLGSTYTNTPSSPTRGASVGIIKTPSTANAGSTLDNFSARVN